MKHYRVRSFFIVSVPSDDKRESHFSADKDAYGADHMSEITVAGRVVLNLWRIIKHEVKWNTPIIQP